ncbi:hypothetical protein DPMN_086545 [Dreissena polymorpha]|uniref:Uncharacterized protein n=1 Tax=Dreissena polymorpha TaxID=45954 RepID=A0A9D4QVA9_DREPO|nr:hypothetical protein DPMN_086545 [Dreissena polymorpha]
MYGHVAKPVSVLDNMYGHVTKPVSVLDNLYGHMAKPVSAPGVWAYGQTSGRD